MSLVQGIVIICLFLIGICAIEHLFRKSGFPYICWIMLFGVGYGVLQDRVLSVLPEIRLSPDVILFVFLPLLIFDSSRKIKFNFARKVILPSSVLATLGLVVSMFVMALSIRLFWNVPLVHILLFTAIMSATDPVAVSAVFSRFKVPEKLKTLIECESLLNDGTTVILFALLSSRVIEEKSFVLHNGVLFFFISVIGAVLLGILAGAATAWTMRKWKALHDHFVGALLPLLVVYLVFCFTQRLLDISGVIAVMSATMTIRYLFIMRWHNDIPPKVEMDFYRDFWSFLGELANAVLFFILGIEIGGHAEEIAWRLLLLSIGALVISRSLVVYGFGMIFRLMKCGMPLSWMHVLNMGGLKGALSVALVLLIPEQYAYRHTFLCAALVLCLFTMIFNTLILQGYLKKAGLQEIG